MIKNGHYYCDYIWKNTLHKIEATGEYKGDCALGFIVGNRRGGKSVTVGIFGIADFLLYGYQNVLIRRYKDDFVKKKAMEKFWLKGFPWLKEFPEIVRSDIKLQEIYPLELVENFNWNDHTIDFTDGKCLIDGRDMCFPCALNMYNDFKNENFFNVHKMIYDEFVAEDGSRLNNEVFALFNVYDTAARGREDALKTTSVIFISNSITNTNDFYTELGIDKELRADTKRLHRPQKGYCLENVMNKEAADEMASSAIAAAMQGPIGQRYLGYSQNNEVKDDESFVERLDGNMRYIMNFRYEQKTYALKYDFTHQLYYFTDDGIDNGFKLTYALTRDDHTLDTVLITSKLRMRLQAVKASYGCGNMRFNSMRSKAIFLELYRFI